MACLKEELFCRKLQSFGLFHKSNSAYLAIDEAIAIVRKTGNLPVPLHLRNAQQIMKNIGYGKDYKYAHNYDDNFAELEFLPEEISNTKFYNPGKNSREEDQRRFLKQRWKDKYDY